MRFGFVGLGWAARRCSICPRSAQVRGRGVVGGFDAAPERRTPGGSATRPPAFGSIEQLVAEARPEVLVVATPPDSHAEVCLAALERGCTSSARSRSCSRRREPTGARGGRGGGRQVVAVNHEFREKPIFRAIRDGAASGRVGRLVFCQIWQLMELAPWDEPSPGGRRWRTGRCFEGGVHLVDLMLTIYSARRRAPSTRAAPRAYHDQADADAIHLLTLEFSQGRLGQITIDRLCRAGTRYVEVRADCEEASLRAHSAGGRARPARDEARPSDGVQVEFGAGGLAWAERGTSRTGSRASQREAGSHRDAAALQGLVRAVEQGGEPPSSAREARDVLAVIEAAYRSAASGERVPLDWPVGPVADPEGRVATSGSQARPDER